MLEGFCHCGGVRWSFEGVPDSVTACSCTICRRYGALWAYDFDNERIKLSGATTVYAWRDQWLGFHFCARCGCVAYWRQTQPGKEGRHRVGVNVRLAEPDAVASLPVQHHDGLQDHADFPLDGRRVADIWF
ncbi:MAG: hypothetical protein RL033_935 [Pseudomonadota bacterium]|jgi:hypothetical protein